MLNFVQRVFVGKASGAASTSQTVGQALSLSTVTVGDLYLLDENGLVLDAAAAATAQKARVVRGTAPGKVISSSLLVKPSAKHDKYTFQAYQAPVAQVTTFADLGLQPNTEYKLEVILQQDLPLVSNRQDRIEVQYVTGASVGVADINKIVASFNKQRKSLGVIVASAAGTTGITLTAQPVLGSAIDDYSFVRFDAAFVTYTGAVVNGNRIYLSAPTAIQPSSVTPAVGGSGTAVQVRALERVSLSNFGFTDPRATWYKGQLPYGAVDGVGYDLYNVQQLLSGEYQFQDTKTYPHSTVVAVVTGSAQKTAFGAVLDSFIQGVAPATATGE